MIAFHGDTNLKQKYLERVKAHALADEIIHGKYWEEGKGCAVGCTIHGSNHSRYENELGIPRILARLEDRIFEGMPNGDSKEFPLRFLCAIEPGADLSLVWYQFAHWLLVDPEDGVIQFSKTDKTKKAINQVAELYGRAARGLRVEKHEWESAHKTAAAADAAAYAAAAADAAAYAAATADAAAYAAAAADAAAYAAYAAYAAAAAAYAAYAAAAAAYAADAAARRKAFRRQADKLIELLAAAPVPIEAAA
jgi:hypothetical protein